MWYHVCAQVATRQEVEARLARCRGLLAGSSDRDSAEVTEQLLVSLAPLLHEDHSYRVQLKSRLVFSYNAAAGSRQQLDRQLQLAEQVRLQLRAVVRTSAVKRSIGSTTSFHNHGEGPY